MFDTSFLYNGKEWFISHQKNLLLLMGVLIVGALAFESGFLRGKISQSEPIVISIPAIAEPSIASEKMDTDKGSQSSKVERIVATTSQKQGSMSCPLVGSKNSNKYHLITCAVAKRIKPENKVCFSSKEDAEKRGYVAGCIK